MKSINLLLFLSTIFVFSGCGSNKVAHTTLINTTNSYSAQLHSKNIKKSRTYEYPSITKERKKEFLARINEARAERRSCGKYGTMGPVGPLVWSDKLYEASYLHSYDMANSKHFGHQGSGSKNDRIATNMGLGRGSKLRDRMSYTDYRWRAIGENIAAGYHSTQEVIEAWLRSDEHCVNLMNENFTEVGMAYYKLNGKFQQPYWSQDFGHSI